MIEILVVIVIMLALTALAVPIVKGVQERSKRSKAKVQIQAIADGLEQYKTIWGNYPEPANGSKNPIDQAKMLYQAMSGDGTNMIRGGVPPTPSDGRTDPQGKLIMPAAFAGSKTAHFVHEDYYLMDPWGRPYNYMRGDEDNQTFNKTTFDLWTEASRKPNDDEEIWVTNWQ